MSAEAPRSDRRTLAIAAVVVVVVAVLLAYVLSRGESGEDVVISSPAATPVETPGARETPSPTEAATPTATPSVGAPTPSAPAGMAEPTDADVAAFVAAEGPADQTATGDVTGDGVDEVVVGTVRNNAVRIVVGTWDGQAYRRTFRDEGGPAERLTSVTVQDYNGRPGAEIVTEQEAGTEGRSISVWGPRPGGIERQEARGGCWKGSATYGISGVVIEPGRITATCDGSPEPPDAWTSDVYEWRNGRWSYTETVEPGES